jgi:hypothetical protein
MTDLEEDMEEIFQNVLNESGNFDNLVAEEENIINIDQDEQTNAKRRK